MELAALISQVQGHWESRPLLDRTVGAGKKTYSGITAVYKQQIAIHILPLIYDLFEIMWFIIRGGIHQRWWS